MSRRVPDSRLELLHVQASSALRRIATNDHKRPGPKGPVWVQMDARDLAPLLDELRRRRRKPGAKGGFRLGALTKTLMAMQPGETVTLGPTTQGKLTGARRSARKALGVPDARWHSETQPDGSVRVERLEDGADQIYGKPRNPAVAILAGMVLGQTVTLDMAGHLPTPIKHQARALAKSPGLQWKTERLANGKLKVWRIR